MSEDNLTSIERQKRDKLTIWIIILAVVFIIMCSCTLIFLIIGWYLGDYVVDWLGFVAYVGKMLIA